MEIKVLVVEDEAMTAMYMKTILQHAGFNVVRTVSTGEKAVRYALELKPDIILMDIRLAGKMNGLDAVSEIRSESGIPVIFMSGYSDDDIKSSAARLNPVAYLTKPVNSEELISIIRNYFNAVQH